jgi:uncharacterized membrane protein
MNKQEFLSKLKNSLSRLPKKEVDERIEFYSEMIDDRVEDGLIEEQAIAGLGTVEQVATQIVSEIPLSKIVTERIKPKRKMKAWEIVLLVVGSPIWLALLISAFAVAISLYAVLWALVVSAWAVVISFGAGVVGGVLGGLLMIFTSNALSGLALIGAGITCVGLMIFAYFGVKNLDKATIALTKWPVVCIKKSFINKED